MTARTTIVIATRDRSDELNAVLRRLLATVDCPIIVVDNNSHDDTVSVARAHGRRSAGRVSVVELADNLGAVARNVGVQHCRTPFVAFCDDDSWWEPESFELAEQLFDRHPSVALLAARTTVWPDRRDDPMVDQLRRSPLGHRSGLPGPSILGFMACAAMVRTEAFRGVGGFSEVLHFRGEEQLLALDLAAAGWDLCYCSGLVAVHRPSPVRQTGAAQQARVLRNAALTAWMRRPVRVCVRDAAALARAAAAEPAAAQAAVEALRLLPAAMRQRRKLPAALEREVRMLEQR
jgi:GT2 family glycosyltransferase